MGKYEKIFKNAYLTKCLQALRILGNSGVEEYDEDFIRMPRQYLQVADGGILHEGSGQERRDRGQI